MAQRLELQELLKSLLGSNHVYFQPPPSIQMNYPAIVYRRDFAETKFADDEPYDIVKRYQVTVIDRNPDSLIPGKVAQLPMCVFNRFYAVEGLNHDVYNIFF